MFLHCNFVSGGALVRLQCFSLVILFLKNLWLTSVFLSSHLITQEALVGLLFLSSNLVPEEALVRLQCFSVLVWSLKKVW